MTVVESYLTEFYEKPKLIEDYKIAVLKNYYYKILMDSITVNNIIFDLSFDDFLIGVNTNKKFLFYKSKKDDRFEIVYNRVFNDYYVRFKGDNKIYILNTLNDLNNRNISYEKNKQIIKSSTKKYCNEDNEDNEDNINIINNSVCLKKCNIM